MIATLRKSSVTSNVSRGHIAWATLLSWNHRPARRAPSLQRFFNGLRRGVRGLKAVRKTIDGSLSPVLGPSLCTESAPLSAKPCTEHRFSPLHARLASPCQNQLLNGWPQRSGPAPVPRRLINAVSRSMTLTCTSLDIFNRRITGSRLWAQSGYDLRWC